VIVRRLHQRESYLNLLKLLNYQRIILDRRTVI